MNYNEDINEFFSKERDTEVWWLLPRLKERMLNSLRDFPPPHPDDWRPKILDGLNVLTEFAH
jgi:hypothetical protein